MSRVLLFVQTGDTRPKCATRENMIRVNGEWWFSRYSAEKRDAADRWWLVECENADLGRMAITTQTEQFGRILASGGRAA